MIGKLVRQASFKSHGIFSTAVLICHAFHKSAISRASILNTVHIPNVWADWAD
jgi:hypothetical protein